MLRTFRGEQDGHTAAINLSKYLLHNFPLCILSLANYFKLAVGDFMRPRHITIATKQPDAERNQQQQKAR